MADLAAKLAEAEAVDQGRPLPIKLEDKLAEAQALQDQSDRNANSVATLGDVVKSFGMGAVKGLAGLLGLPADVLTAFSAQPVFTEGAPVANLMVQETGALPGFKVPYGAADVLAAARKAGADYTPQTDVGKGAEVLGENVVPMVALGPLALTTATPVRAVGMGLGLAAGATVGQIAGGEAGATIAESTGGNPETGRAVGEIVGNVAGGLGVGGASNVASRGIGLVRRAVEPFTAEGVTSRAAERVQSAATDAEAAARALAPGPLPVAGSLTSAQVAGDAGLLSLERSVIRTNAQISGKFRDAEAATNTSLRGELQAAAGGEGGPQVVQEYLKGDVSTLTQQLDQRLQGAIAAARTKADDLGVALPPDRASALVRTEIESALTDARREETALWSGIKSDAPVSMQPVRDKLVEMQLAARKADAPENFPKDLASVVFQKLKATEPADEVLALRSRILAEKRAEGGKDVPNRARLSALDDLQESVLDALGATAKRATETADPEAGKIRAALQFSRVLNDRFTRGPIGKILGYDARGGERVPDVMTLEKLFAPGQQGAVNADALTQAVGGADKIDYAARNFILQKFAEQATDSAGKVNPTAAQRFLTRYGLTLERFPEVRAQLGDAAQAQRVADAMAQTTARSLKDLADSRAALFTDVDPSKAINTVLNSAKPVDGMRELVGQVKRDPSGQAFLGLKQAFYEEMLGRISLGTLDTRGAPLVSARKLRDFIADNERVMNVLYTPQELMRMRTVQQAANMAEKSATSALRGGSDTAQNLAGANLLHQAAARVIGSTVGSHIGMPLVGAGIGSKITTMLDSIPAAKVQQLLETAIFDPDVMRTLLMRPIADNRARIAARLRGHLFNLGLDIREQDQGGQQKSGAVAR